MSEPSSPKPKRDSEPIVEIRLPPPNPRAAIGSWIWIVLGLVLIGNIVAWLLIAQVRDRLVGGFEEAEEVGRWFEAMTAIDSRFALITPTPAGDADLRGRAIHDIETKRTVLHFENLEAPEGQVFRLWVIRGDETQSLGEIRPDERGHAVLQLEIAGSSDDLDAFAVSLEAENAPISPDGPRGKVVMLGPLER